jgi:hypothetical protein
MSESHQKNLQNPSGATRVSYPLAPGWLVLITLVAGLSASGPLAGAAMYRYGYRKVGWILGSATFLLGLTLFYFMILWNNEWYWPAIALTGVHLLGGISLFLGLRGPHKIFKEHHPPAAGKRGTYREIIAGIVGGAFVGTLLGVLFSVCYLILTDHLFSTLMPVTFEDSFAGFKVFTCTLFIVLSGTAAGGLMGRFKPQITAGQMISYGLALVWAYFSWLLAMECTIAIPGFQAGAATGEGWRALIAPYYSGNLLIGIWWSVFLMFFMISAVSASAKWRRVLQVVGINLAAGITLSITFGYPADMYLALGRHFERSALTENALWSYEHGLKKKPQAPVASYLQYRSALLYHRMGDQQKSIKGFRRVVAKYTANKTLVKKANRLLDNLDRSRGGKRVVLKGVETRTEYKGGYCVPNSLALAMRYWGADVTARVIGKRITGLGSGTFIVNQRWFAEQEGYRHDFLPMANLDDIKQCIDAGFPVLVYVPRHVFAIVGYDEALRTFVTYDVATHDVWVEYIQEDFIKAWKKQATTLVLAYPPEKEKLIPANILNRITNLSDNYLHFQLHYFDAPTASVSVPHLFKAADATDEFFFPITILYAEFPGLREKILAEYDTNLTIDAIKSYFKDNFDEGIHEAGQHHSERWARPDWAFSLSLQYVIGNRRFDDFEELVTQISAEGRISDGVLADLGMIDLARGNLEIGLDRLSQAPSASKPFYIGLTSLKMGNQQAAVRNLVGAIKARARRYRDDAPGSHVQRRYSKYRRRYPFFTDSKKNLTLDDYGFPDMALANDILVQMENPGESREDLEEAWWKWIHYLPFDAPVSEALLKLYQVKLAKIDKDTAAYQRLKRRITLIQKRAARYKVSSFSQPH